MSNQSQINANAATCDESQRQASDGKAQFLGWQAELETLGMSVCMGQETDATLERIKLLERYMDESPWLLCPDRGCILKSEEVGV